MLLIDDRMTVN